MAKFKHPQILTCSDLITGDVMFLQKNDWSRDHRRAHVANTEEEAVQLTGVVPFLVEDMLKSNGGNYSKGADWQPYVVSAGHLITGQNPASSELAANELLKMLTKY